MNKKSILLSIIITLCGLLCGCYDSQEIDELAYGIALGLDKGTTNALHVTIQLAVPKNLGGSSTPDQKNNGASSKLFETIAVEAPSINSSFDMLNTSVSRKIKMSHSKIVVISEELAKENPLTFLRELVRNRDFRPNTFFVVSRTSAEEYLTSVNPILEVNPAKYYELNLMSGKLTSTTPVSTINTIYNQMLSNDRQPLAILAGVNKFTEGMPLSAINSTFRYKENRRFPYEGDFYAGDITKHSEIKSEIMGSAVFRNEYFVGELDGEETSHVLMATNEFSPSTWTFTDPQKKDEELSLIMSLQSPSKKSVELINGKPIINLKLSLEASILSLHSGINYEKVDKKRILEDYIKDYLKKAYSRTFYKISRKYKSDVFGFGQYAKMKYLTWDDWIKSDWQNAFPLSSLNLDIDFTIRRAGLMIKSDPAGNSEGSDSNED